MGWLYVQNGTYLYISSVVLILESALFFSVYFYLKKKDSFLLNWSIGLAVLSLLPIACWVSVPSFFLSGCLFWIVQSTGALFIVKGLPTDLSVKKRIHSAILAFIILTSLSILSFIAASVFTSYPIWISLLLSMLSVAVFLYSIVKLWLLQNKKQVYVIFSLLILSASSAYCSISLLLTGKIEGFDILCVGDSLLLCFALSYELLLYFTRTSMNEKSKLQCLMNNTTLGLALVNRNGTVDQLNMRMLEILGIDPALYYSRPFTVEEMGLSSVLMQRTDNNALFEAALSFDALKASGMATARQGTAKLSVCVRELNDIVGSPHETFIQIDDITTTKDMIDELKDKRYNFEVMFQATGTCEYSRIGSLIYSERLFKALGYNYTSLDLNALKELVHPHDWERLPPQPDMEDLHLIPSYSAEIRLKNSEGIYIWYYISDRAEVKENELFSYGIAINIDLHKRMESHIMQSERLAAVGTLANSVAHDINNHLMTMKTSLTLLNSVTDELQKKKYSSYMQEAIANSSGILKSLVSFSRGEENGYTPISMNSMLAITISLLERSLGGGVKLLYQCEAEEDIVLGNYYELQNIFLNIGLNARDALPQTGGEIKVKAWVADSNPLKQGSMDRWYYLSIRDNGCGMSAEVQKKIFDPFFTTKPNGRGSGLGLFTAYGNIQHHKGTIHVESIEGEGTEFVMAFPLFESCGGESEYGSDSISS